MSLQWHYTEKGQQRGPISAEELKSRAASGVLGPDDLVWKEGMTEWIPARKVKGLLPTPQATTNSPPPLPLPPAQAETKTPGVLDALKTAGIVAAKQAERTKLITVSLTGAYYRLGKALYEANVGRDKTEQEFFALDALKDQMTGPAPPVEPAPQPQGLAQQAKSMAKATSDAAQRKVAKTRYDHALVTLGKSAYEKRHELDLPQREATAIEAILLQVITVDTEIGELSAQKPAQSLVDATLRSTRRVGWSLIDNRIVHSVLTVGCFPIGLFLVWRSQLWSKRAKVIWTGVVAGMLVLGMYNSVVATRAMNASLSQANAAWEAGKVADSIDLYRGLLDDHWFRMDEADRATLLRRVVEYYVNHDNEPAARTLLEKALRNRVAVSFEGAKAQQLQNRLQAELAATKTKNDAESESHDLTAWTERKAAIESEIKGMNLDQLQARFGSPTTTHASRTQPNHQVWAWPVSGIEDMFVVTAVAATPGYSQYMFLKQPSVHTELQLSRIKKALDDSTR